jgi:REP element-mobilizing transposase RayT
MTVARSTLIDAQQPGTYHCISRCVRRAFLCGDRWEHRKSWIEQRIAFLGQRFAMDVMAYAVMSNHLHIVVRTRPDVVRGWGPDEVARRWADCYPRRNANGDAIDHDDNTLAAWADNPLWVEQHRERLGSLSWFMKLIKEPLARLANHEDGCTGAFWEGRFKSVALLDQAAVIACMAYADLNPIRATLASTPEDSLHTGVYQRIQARQSFRKREGLCAARAPVPAELTLATSPEARCWLTPLSDCSPRPVRPGNPWVLNTLSLDEYLELVDATGRCLANGKSGSIPDHLKPILERLDISVERWLISVCGIGHFLGTAIGSAAARAAEAIRRGGRWIVDKAQFYRAGPAPNPSG